MKKIKCSICGKKEIDAVIVTHSQAYDLERIPRVERNIVRLGIYELLFSPDVPRKVVIAEAMRLARKFATKEAASFVNALMDSVYKSIENPETLEEDKVYDEQSNHTTV